MSIVDDRRSEPRFPVEGRVEISSLGQTQVAQMVDLSLNGALLVLPEGHGLLREHTILVQLWIGGSSHFNAQATVVYVQAERVGIEFTGMSTADFDTFSGLILLLARQRIGMPV
jgi:hypothetical protein